MKRKQPNVPVEIFFSCFKWFTVALVLLAIAINGIWALVHTGYFSKSFGGTSVEMTQDGQNNNQSMTNG